MRTLAKILLFFSLLLSAVLLSGCAEIPDVVQSRYSEPVGEIRGARTVGQTFVAHQDGLSRIDVLLATYARKNTHSVTFRLKRSPDAGDDIAAITFSAAKVKDNAFHQFTFAPIPDSKGQAYFFVIESPQSSPGNAITIWHDPGDAYDEGAMVVDGQATDGDLAFRTYYGRLGDLASDVRSGLDLGLALLVLAALLFTLPGSALLVLLPAGEDFDLVQRLILSVGLSVALFPLLLYGSTNLGFRLDRTKAAGLLVICGVVFCWGLYRAKRRSPELVRGVPAAGSLCEPEDPQQVGDSYQRPRPGVHHGVKSSPAGAWFFQHGGLAPCLLAFVFALSLAVRLLMIRGMPYPAWSDSYHHTIISQMIAEGGAIPQSYRPYIPLDTFAYHFGFHSTVAFFHWITGLGIPQAVLVVGQILNALSVLSIYLLARYLTEDRWAALASALIVGLLSVMPAYYVNWGRYPQLGGQVVFPVAAVLTLKCLAAARLDYRGLISTALAASGLFLTHYRVVLFYALFVVVYLFCQSWSYRREIRKVVRLWLRAFLLAALSLIVVAPWLRLLISEFAAKIQQAPAHGFELDAAYNLISWDIILSLGLRPGVLIMAALGALWGLWRRDKRAVLVAVWTVSLFALANPHVLGLPGVGLVNNGTVVMALYMPGSILAGFLVSYVHRALVPALERERVIASERQPQVCTQSPAFKCKHSWRLLRRSAPRNDTNAGLIAAALHCALAVVVILVSLWGAGDTLQLLTPQTFFVTPSDLKAMTWIRENVPQDAVFAINTHFWLSYAAIGTDAGYWIPFLTGRKTTLPPMLYSEGSYEYVDEVNALARATAGLCENDDALPVLEENGVTHVYVGQRGGCLRPQKLLASPHYEAAYHQDGVWIFEVRG